jgi:hypothetical protein
MPHVNEFRATLDHAGHDRLLVAALAAGDLAGADRDHALDLTRTCAGCAELRDDLIALARATAAVPAPHARPRDFQLTPADAARLRPAGWRRLLGGLAGARLAATRPLGVGLATIGLAGLLIGNAPIFSLGSSASSPTSAGVPSAGGAEDAAGAQPAAASAGAPNLVPVPAPSAAASVAAGGVFGTAEGPSPSTIAAPPTTEYDASSIPGRTAVGAGSGGAQSSGSTTAAGGPKSIASQPASRDLVSTAPAADGNPLRPLNLVFALAVLTGLALLVASRVRSRSRT